MADTLKEYLDLEGLTKYDGKIKGEIGKKVDSEVGKGLSTNDYTTSEKEKLAGLKNYTLPVAAADTLGGVQIETTEDPVPANTALKADASGKVFVDWAQAPKASTSDAGLVKLGAGFKVNETTGAAEVDASSMQAGSVDWNNIQNKPELALKTDVSTVYNYKGSVANVSALPTENNKVGDVYNTEATGMNYAWNGTEWDALGEILEIKSISDAQIDALFESSGT